MISNIGEKILVKHLVLSYSQCAFLKLYKLHEEALFQLAMQLTAGHKPSAERIILDTWAAAIVKLPSFSGKSQLISWLTAILINCSREHYYKQNFYMLIHDDLNEKPGVNSFHLNNTEEIMDVERALRLLPVGYRHVFILHDIKGYKPLELCELLQINEGTCKSHLFNARKTLRLLMQGIFLYRVNQYVGWNVDEMKSFKLAFTNVALPDELRDRVVKELFNRSLIVEDHTPFSWRKVFAQSLMILMIYLAVS
jgi:RNA polymerase sigma-70 factor (ECF subfamily)